MAGPATLRSEYRRYSPPSASLPAGAAAIAALLQKRGVELEFVLDEVGLVGWRFWNGRPPFVLKLCLCTDMQPGPEEAERGLADLQVMFARPLLTAHLPDPLMPDPPMVLQGGSIMMDGLTGKKDLPFPIMDTVRWAQPYLFGWCGTISVTCWLVGTVHAGSH